MSSWFNGLPPSDRSMVAEIARDAAHAAVFDLLCILDGPVGRQAAHPSAVAR
jgi:hypothetical protein